MAVAAFWNVAEPKLNVFECLDNDICVAAIARCARVHITWTDLALDVLYRGDNLAILTGETYEIQRRARLQRHAHMCTAIARMPHGCR
jgi:hypothetical protein